MNTTYTLNLSNEVTTHFRSLLDQWPELDKGHVVSKAKTALKEMYRLQNVSYIKQRIDGLNAMINMLSDDHWKLSVNDKQFLLTTLHYFVENDDIIPDDTPVIGYLDDCIVIDMAKDQLNDELRLYHQYIRALKAYDLDTQSNPVDAWKVIRQKETVSRVRHRRRKHHNARKH